MKRKTFLHIALGALLFAFIGVAATAARAQTTAFTYQGRFSDATVAQPTNGTYTMTFRLFDAETGGNQIPNNANGITSMVSVVNGIFTVKLDFGAEAFGTNGARYLEIQVGNTTLTPRQEITSTPFANRAVNAATADALSSSCVGCVTNQQINSIDGGKITGTVTNAVNATNATTATNVSGVVAIANGGTGSTSKNFVDLTTDQTIGGNKAFSGIVSGSVFNAATQFNIGGSRVLGNGGARNLFAGIDAGRVNTGEYNSFVGWSAGFYNTTGNGNSFFGSGAGTTNTIGLANSFFGRDAGISNSTGENNSFFGAGAGLTNRTGSNNTLLGTLADVGSVSLNYATAIGAGAKVTSSNTVVLGRTADDVSVPGDLLVSGTFNATLRQSATTVYGTAALTVTRTNQNFVLVPGLTQTINVPANADIVISTDGGLETLSETDDGISIVDVAIFIDGLLVSMRAHDITNESLMRTSTNWTLSAARTLAAGNHTIEVRSRSSDESFLSNASVSSGGNENNPSRGQLTVTIIKR